MQAPSAVVPLDPLGRCSGRPMERTEPEKGERKKGRTKKGMFESAKEKRETVEGSEEGNFGGVRQTMRVKLDGFPPRKKLEEAGDRFGDLSSLYCANLPYISGHNP